MKDYIVYYIVNGHSKYFKNIKAKNLQECEILFLNWLNARYSVPIVFEIVKIEQKIENIIFTVKEYK